jgi:hypothetical protein
MTVKSETVRAMNAAHAQIDLTEQRVHALPVELNQLRDAAERVRARIDFDADPFGFRAAVLRAWRGQG